jgi:imidazolonepropionase
MLIHSASQLLTLTPKPQRGKRLGELGLINNGAVLIQAEKIIAVGSTPEFLATYPHEPRLDAANGVVMPGFIDAHTHLVWAGDRAAEFEMRLQGKPYLEILAAGRGILSTVSTTRKASLLDLKAQTRQRSYGMFRQGTTTAEAKSGYGLELKSELQQLQVLLELDQEGPLEIHPTFLAAHAIPPEFTANPQDYTDLICQSMLPALKTWWSDHAPYQQLPFVDVFCEQGAFLLQQTRQILTAAKALGFPLKVHVDEFENLGGAALAVELGAVSADHLVKTSLADISILGKSATVAVSLPCTPFGLAEPAYSPARAILDADGILAVASDLNPGTAWCGDLQFVLALACRYLRLTPAQAIAAATINAAAAIQCSDRIGSIHAGKQADLLILNVPDYQQLGYRFGGNLVRTVIKRGHIYPIQSPDLKESNP